MTSRRQFLKKTGGVITLAIGGLQFACSVEESSRIEAAGLSDDQILILVRILQHILPHETLEAQVYIDAVTLLADRASADEKIRQMLIDGISDLSPTSPWLALSGADQLSALKAIDGSDFFNILQKTALEQIYCDKRTWGLVGYEGESIKFGGYINRGFNDIDWLPEPNKNGEVN